jgi:outer membrane protein TolC
MKRRMKTLLIVIVWSIQATNLMAQDSLKMLALTFDKALEMTLQNSHTIKQSNYQVQEKDQAMKASRGLYLPKIGVSATYAHMAKDITMDLTPVKDAITPLYSTLANYGTFSGVPNPDPTTNKFVPILPDNLSTAGVRSKLADGLSQLEAANWNQMIQKKDFATVAATAQWPIYAGGKVRIANKVASIEKKEAEGVSIQKQGELTGELVERYFGLCLAMQAVSVRHDVLIGVSKHLSDAEKLEKDGMIANAEVLQAKLFYANADREMKKAKRNVGTINEGLINTLALSNDTLINPTTELFYIDSIEPVGYFIKSALDKNPSLQQVEDKKQLVEQNYKAQISEFLPTVAAMGTYNVWNKDLSTYIPDWMVGIGLNYTLFDGASRFRKVKAASFKANQVEEVKEKVQSDLSTVIHKLYNELNINIEQLQALESSKNFAEELVRVREKAFHEDMSNSTEVVDAQLSLAQVRIDRLQAMYNYDVCLARLLQYAGIPEQFTAYKQRTQVKTESYKEMK